MADHVVDSFQYSDNGKVIKKDTWRDDSGQQWDTFTTMGDDASSSPNGTVLSNQGTIAQSAADQFYGQAQRGTMAQQTTTASQVPRGTGGNQPAPPPPPPPGPYAPAPAPRPVQGGSPVSVNPNNPIASPPQGAPASPQPPSMVPTAPGSSPLAGEIGRDSTLYNWDNPTQAMVNALRTSGFNMDANSPILQMLLRAAPGIANAFRVQGAVGNDQNANKYGEFGSYLQNAIKTGSIPSALQGASAALSGGGGLMDQVRAYSRADPSNNPLASNELLGSLAASMGNNNGAGILDIINSLQSPMMSRSGASGFQNLLAGPTGLGSRAQTAWSGGVDPTTGSNPNDYWYYLLGH